MPALRAGAGARQRIAECTYEDRYGIEAVAKVGKLSRSKRFDRGTAQKVIDAWLESTRVSLRLKVRSAKRSSGTLAGDVAAYLATLPNKRSTKNTGWELGAWVAALGECRTDRLEADRLRKVQNGWIECGVPSSTINHRRRALAHLFEWLNGKEAANPARDVPRVRERLGDPIAYPIEVLTAIIDGMDESPSHARLRVLLWSGMPPAGLMQLDPRKVRHDLESLCLYYPARNKGEGAEAVTLPIFPECRRALECWLRVRANGRFSQASLGKALRRAATAYAQRCTSSPVPPDEITPYHLRHSFLTWLYVKSGDPYLVQKYGQHADLKTTRRYTRKGIPERAVHAVAKITAELNANGPMAYPTGPDRLTG
jgi:site-specific recombinase XerC